MLVAALALASGWVMVTPAQALGVGAAPSMGGMRGGMTGGLGRSAGGPSLGRGAPALSFGWGYAGAPSFRGVSPSLGLGGSPFLRGGGSWPPSVVSGYGPAGLNGSFRPYSQVGPAHGGVTLPNFGRGSFSPDQGIRSGNNPRQVPDFSGPRSFSLRPSQPSILTPRAPGPAPRWSLGSAPSGTLGRLPLDRGTLVPRSDPGRVSPLTRPRVEGFLSTRPSPTVSGMEGGLSGTIQGALPLDRSRVPGLDQAFQRIVKAYGPPKNQQAFVPRGGGGGDQPGPGHAVDGERGDRHGFFDWDDHGRHRHHGDCRDGNCRDRDGVVFNTFFYPWYSSGLWSPFYSGMYPSVYSQWGWDPGWIYPSQGYYQPDYTASYGGTGGYYPPSYEGAVETYQAYPSTPEVTQSPAPTLDSDGVARTLEDIRSAWLGSNLDPLAAHLSEQLDVQVYFDGAYTYTTKAKDYSVMTMDSMSNIKTGTMEFDSPIWISPTDVFVTGRQVFTDPDGVQNTMYLSYRLQQYGAGWFITAFGSSRQPISSEYRDFRS